jgi:hypothetical protein
VNRVPSSFAYRRVAPILLALLAGCQWMDTRPGVSITPAGDLVGSLFVDLQVDAGGAPRAQLFIDGHPVGAPIPTGQVFHLDLQTLAEGEHQLFARVEQGSSPRTSETRRLLRPITPPRLPIVYTSTREPWSRLVVEFTSTIAMQEIQVTTINGAGQPVPFTQVVAPDRKKVTVDLGATLAELRALNVRLDATGVGGERGTVIAAPVMPVPIQVRTSAWTPGHLEFTATPDYQVPGASLWVTDHQGVTVQLGDFGPSPWVVRIPDHLLGAGYRWLQFRRPDALFPEIVVEATQPSDLVSCSLEGQPATMTPRRCLVVRSLAPLGRIDMLVRPAGVFPTSLGPGQEWRVCIPETAWRAGPTSYSFELHPFSPIGFQFWSLPCNATSGWEWLDPGADPITDGTSPLKGRPLAIDGSTPEVIRIGYAGSTGSPAEGRIFLAGKASTPGVFTPGDPVNAAPAAEGTVLFAGRSGVVWRRVEAPGIVEGMLEEGVAPAGLAWMPWPPAPLSPDLDVGASSLHAAADSRGPALVGWIEATGGASVARVRWRDAGWSLLPSILPKVPGSDLIAVRVAATRPTPGGPVVALVEAAAVTGVQTLRIVNWNGTIWEELGGPDVHLGSTSIDPIRMDLYSDNRRLWLVVSRWDGTTAYELAPNNTYRVVRAFGTGPGNSWALGFPEDGREPVEVVLDDRYQSGKSVRGIRVIPLVDNTPTPEPIVLMPSGTVTNLVFDPDGMSIAWTDEDGNIHVRTLTP